MYNEFPLMGGRLAPPKEELLSPAYAQRADGKDLWWRNIFENPTTVQFDHRLLVSPHCWFHSTFALWTFFFLRLQPRI